METPLVKGVYEAIVQTMTDPFEASVAKGHQQDPNQDTGTILLSFKADLQMLA